MKSWQSYNYGFVWEGQKCALSLIMKNEITRPGLCPLSMRAEGYPLLALLLWQPEGLSLKPLLEV